MMHEAMKPTTKKRILLVANTARFFVLFEQNDIHILQEMGYEVHCASNFEGEKDVDAKAILSKAEVVLHQLDIARSPISTGNVKAYRQLQALTQQIRFDAVHCHTPMGSVLARLAAKSIGISPIIYTVHGLHFYKGCPIQNRVLYEPVERCLARCTDALITINEEDYRTAQTFHLRGKAYKVPGVGIDVKAISGISVEREEKRKEIGVPINAAVIISVGDLIKRKNHIVALRAFAKANIPDSYYVLCGNGEEKQTLQSEAQLLGVERRVLFLGYRNDVRELLRAADVFCFPSLQEGLPVALMEAMASGLPCVASRIRGNTDLLGENYKYLFAPNEPDKLAALLPQLLENKDAIGDECFGKIKAFDISEVQQEMRKIYADTLNKNGGGYNG